MSTFDWQEKLKRVLDCFAIDVFAEWQSGQIVYTARLWDDGAEIAEVQSSDLYGLIVKLDQAADDIVSYC